MRTLLLLLLSQCVLACHRPELSYRKVHCRGIVNVRNDLKLRCMHTKAKQALARLKKF